MSNDSLSCEAERLEVLETAFFVREEFRQQVARDLGGMSQYELDGVLHEVNGIKQPGLVNRVLEAHDAGDFLKLRSLTECAQLAAHNRVIRDQARLALKAL